MGNFMSSIKCGGGCCEKFCTQWSPREWKRRSKSLRDGNKTWKDDHGKEYAHSTNSDEVLKISDMLIHIETKKERPNKRDDKTTLNSKYFYTCMHFNKATRLCGDYKNRPNMCSGYPENTTTKKCHIEGCKCK